jgi:hypothetical protein
VRSGLWRSGHTNNNDDVEKKKEGGELSESFAHSWMGLPYTSKWRLLLPT